MAEKARIYGEHYPIDEDFIAAFAHMPQASGVALGLDRLVMLATGATRIDQVLWAPMKETLGMTPAKTLRNKICALRTIGLNGRAKSDLPAHRSQAAIADRALQQVAARYAVAITPADRRADRSGRSARSDRAAIRSRDAGARATAGGTCRSDRRRCAQPGPRHRAPLSRSRAAQARQRLRGLLPLLLPPRNGRAGTAERCRATRSTARSITSRARRQIWEVILTGGDPLVLSPRRLKDVMARLAAIEHVKVIRLHTRVPVAAPERVTPALVRALRTDKATYVVLHANHPRELTRGGARRLRALGRCRHSDAVARRCCCAASTTMWKRSAR